MTFAQYADRIIVNDNLEKAKLELLRIVNNFLSL